MASKPARMKELTTSMGQSTTNIPQYHKTVSRLMLFFYLLQAIVPIGYMPNALASGSFVQLCPAGLPPELMQLFHPGHAAPENTHHSAHGQHAAQGDASALSEKTAGIASNRHPQANPEHTQWRADCDYGASAPGEFTASGSLNFASNLNLTPALSAAPPIDVFVFQQRTADRPRAPPPSSNA